MARPGRFAKEPDPPPPQANSSKVLATKWLVSFKQFFDTFAVAGESVDMASGLELIRKRLRIRPIELCSC